MKRILSSFCLVLASVASLVAQPFGYTNNQTVLYPGNVTAQALQIDALSFVNNGSYNIKLSGGFGGTVAAPMVKIMMEAWFHPPAGISTGQEASRTP